MAASVTSKKKPAPEINVNAIAVEAGKIPPQAIDMEQAVLGAALLDKDVILLLLDILTPESFYSESHRIIFEGIIELYQNNKPVDLLTITQQLKNQGQLKSIGGAPYLSELTMKVSSASHAVYHAQIVAQKYMQRELIKISGKVQRDAFDESVDVNHLISDTQDEIFELAMGGSSKEMELAGDIVRRVIKQIEENAKSDDIFTGVPSGFHKLDAITLGWQPSDLIIVAARPAMGKTAFTLSMAKNMAIQYKKKIAFFSLEMSADQLITRLMISESGLSREKLKTGKMDKEEWAQLEKGIHNLTSAQLFIDDTPALRVNDFQTKVKKLASTHGLDCVFIDYLQLMTAGSYGSKGGLREQEVSAISRALKATAKELNIPIIALSQLSRSVETAPQCRPQLSHLRESGAIEQDADIVAFIYRGEYYKYSSTELGYDPAGIAEIIIAKHRNGDIGTVRLRFQKEGASFLHLDYEEDQFTSLPQQGGQQKPTFGSNWNNGGNGNGNSGGAKLIASKANDSGGDFSGMPINDAF
jgi:replicative DNA helicase